MSSVFLKNVFNIAALLVLITGASAAFAHAHLEQSTPAADSNVSSVKELRLVFSEGVEDQFAQVAINHDGTSVAVTGIKTEPANKKVLIVTLAQALPAGQYTVGWKVVSVDTHKSNGQYSFTVSN